MEPLAGYGDNMERMMCLKFGWLPIEEALNRRDKLRKKLWNFRENLTFAIKRYEVYKWYNQFDKWTISGIAQERFRYEEVTNKFLFYAGVVELDVAGMSNEEICKFIEE